LAAYDFKANFVNVLTVGAVPVLVDVLPSTPVMDLEQLTSAFTERTKAVLVSHLHGHLAAIEEICDFARSRGVAVIEDACQCPGAMINGRRAGTIGDVGVLSFGGSKLLTSGRGGALLTDNAMMAQRVKLCTQRGNDAYPLSEMQAAIVLPQLKQLDVRNQIRYAAAEQLCTYLHDSPGLTQSMFPVNGSNVPAFYKLAFLLSDDFPVTNRERLCAAARNAGIPLDPAFSALHLIHSKRRFRSVGELANATKLNARMTVLHHTALLRSADQLARMADQIAEIVDNHRR
jgi:dTDP-4-amino-4,6-dideoxygalactose transaminase